jgi:hypothetical protein
VQVLGVSLGFGESMEVVESLSFFRQQLEHEHIRLQQGLQHLKQLRRLQQEGFSSSIVDFMGIIFF